MTSDAAILSLLAEQRAEIMALRQRAAELEAENGRLRAAAIVNTAASGA